MLDSHTAHYWGKLRLKGGLTKHLAQLHVTCYMRHEASHETSYKTSHKTLNETTKPDMKPHTKPHMKCSREFWLPWPNAEQSAFVYLFYIFGLVMSIKTQLPG